VGVEGLAVPGREVGHRRALRLALMLEENRQVRLDDIPQDRHRQRLIPRSEPEEERPTAI
jgi:hypothetical protein